MTQSPRIGRRALLTRLAKSTGALIALPFGLKSALAQQPPGPFVGTTAGQAREVDGVAVRWCPPGQFLMGSPENEPGRRADERQVQVTISTGFWMAAYEVTQSQWRRIVGAFPDRPPSAEFGEGDTFPMYWVNYAEAETFCRRLTERAQKSSGLPAGWVFALPTEAQWEYACRAGTTTASSFGDNLSRAQANMTDPPPSGARFGAGLGRATPVGTYPANPWGLYDMHGNIFEWCRDWYHGQLPGGTDPEMTTRGVPNGDGSYSRVRRGGAWNDPAVYCRSAMRLRYEPERRSDHIGFRVALVPQR